MDWIHQQQEHIDTGKDTAHYLAQISDWQARAQAVAAEASRNSTKKAVEECPPEGDEARAIYHLYAMHAETIWHVCNAALEQTSETDAVELEDVLQESYPLFQRALVSYDPDKGPLYLYLANALKRRVQIYLNSQSHETTDDEAEVEDEGRVAPGYNLPELYSELVDEGSVPAEAVSIFDRLHPDRG